MTTRIHLKVTARHPLVKHILAEREEGRRVELRVDDAAGTYYIIDGDPTKPYRIMPGTPSFRTRMEANRFIEQVRDAAFKARR